MIFGSDFSEFVRFFVPPAAIAVVALYFIFRLIRDLEHLSRQYIETQEDLERSESFVKEREEEIDDVLMSNAILGSKITELTRKASDEAKLASSLRSELMSQRTELSKANEQLRHCKYLLSATQNELAKAKKQHAAQVKSLQDRIDDLSQYVNSVNETFKALETSSSMVRKAASEIATTSPR